MVTQRVILDLGTNGLVSSLFRTDLSMTIIIVITVTTRNT